MKEYNKPLIIFDPLIFSIDFDGTLCENNYPYIGEPKWEIINKCKELKKKGNLLILNTCRETGLLADAILWCADKGLIFDSVNQNLQHRIEFFNEDSRKIGADFYIDDKNLTLKEFLNF